VSEEILALGGVAATPDVVLTGHAVAGMAVYYLGDLNVALPHLEHAATIAASVPPIGIGSVSGSLMSGYDTGVPSLITLGQALTLAGRGAQGQGAVAAALARAGKIETPWYTGYALSGACAIAVIRRDPEQVRQRADQLLRFCGEAQALHLQAYARFMLRWVTVVESGTAAATASLHAALDEVNAVHNPLIMCRNFSVLADVHLRFGQVSQAAEALEQAFSTRGEARYFDAELIRQRAALILARNQGKRLLLRDRKEIEDSLESAIETATRQGTHLFGLRASVELCRFWAATDRADEGRRRLALALAAVDVGDNEIDVRQAQALLAPPA
ncbi:MAG TPA: hypothetical protein VEB21_01355, partial [Terriglobales bacterium]|nr:hypothetical protein [Terriglobales bacterium]